MKKIKRMFDRTLLIYSVVGVLNFIVCTLLMFVLYNQLHPICCFCLSLDSWP